MKKRYVFSCSIVLIIIFHFLWWTHPVKFLTDTKQVEVSKIEIFNGNTGEGFAVSDQQDITFIMRNIQQVTMKKKMISFGTGFSYRLTFINENGQEIDSFIINSSDILRKGNIFYYCNGELSDIMEYLREIETM